MAHRCKSIRRKSIRHKSIRRKSLRHKNRTTLKRGGLKRGGVKDTKSKSVKAEKTSKGMLQPDFENRRKGSYYEFGEVELIRMKKRSKQKQAIEDMNSRDRTELDRIVTEIRQNNFTMISQFINNFMHELPREVLRIDLKDIPQQTHNQLPPSGFGTGYISHDRKHVVKIIDIGSSIKGMFVDHHKIIGALKSELIYYSEITQICPDSFCRFIGYHYNPNNLILRIVMENCGTNLVDIYNSSFTNNRLQIAKNHIGQIILALSCLHIHGYVHRDIKPENIVLHNDRIKLIDAGTLYRQTDDIILNSGTIFYMAPELHGKYIIERSTNLFATDVYSLGVIILFMIMPPSDLKTRIFSTTHNSNFSDNYKILSIEDKAAIKSSIEPVFGETIEVKHFFGEPNERLNIMTLQRMFRH
jgi:serine/threonine protein kinase